MKLCIVVPYFTPYVRGNEYGLAESLTTLGNDVTIIASKGKAPREVKRDLSGNYDFKVKYLPTLLDIGDNPIISGLDIEGYDVALLQEDYPFICHKAHREARKLGIKTILSSERTYYPRGIKGAGLKVLDHLKNKELREGVDVLTAHCSAAREFMERKLRVKREVKLIHVGVDTTLFRPMEPTGGYLPDGQLKILTVARLHNYKGLEYLIVAMQSLKDPMPEAKLYILGKGPEEEKLKTRVKKLGLDGRIVFVEKPIPNYEMPQLYGACDIYVQPSIIEPYGIAVLEAMACGKAVIGTRVGGMLDTIKNGKTGFLVAPKNAEEIADRIMILKNEDKRDEMGKKARKWVVENFDWRVIGERYQEVVEELVSTNIKIKRG
jgi:glycosyltransferase involved in cell wall biosynthesis